MGSSTWILVDACKHPFIVADSGCNSFLLELMLINLLSKQSEKCQKKTRKNLALHISNTK